MKAIDYDQLEPAVRSLLAKLEEDRAALLAALRGFLHADADVFAAELAAARAAIAKAEGEQ